MNDRDMLYDIADRLADRHLDVATYDRLHARLRHDIFAHTIRHVHYSLSGLEACGIVLCTALGAFTVIAALSSFLTALLG